MNGDIYSRQRFEYAYGLNLLRAYSANPQNVRIACLMAIVFSEANQFSTLKSLYQWIYEYIATFYLDDVRNQSELSEKTLAIAIYFFLESEISNQNHLPTDILVKYLIYAEKQDWYEDNFLAYFCHSIKHKIIICERAENLLKKNLSWYLMNAQIPAICQSLLSISDINDADRLKSYEVISQDIFSTGIALEDQSWAMLCLSKSERDGDHELSKQISEVLYQRISQIIQDLSSNNLDASIPIDDSEILPNKSRLSESSSIKNPNRDVVVENNFENYTQGSFQIADLSLLLSTLCLSNFHNVLGVDGYSREKLLSILDLSRKLENEGVILSREANTIGNILALLFTILFGFFVGFYLYKFESHIDQSQIVLPALGDIAVLIVWLDYLVSQIIAICHRKSALEGFSGIPIFRRFAGRNDRKDA